ncbi:PocR ligand-binding domain-containing protein, partial [Methylogaea oryzae]
MDTKSPTESLRFADLVDVERLQALTDSFHHVIGVANAVIDVDGTVLTRSGWQDVCVKFHRVHPDTCRLCVESDTALANRLLKGEPYAVYGCLNGLVDTAAPIVVAGRHVANVFTGQFFSSPPDLEAFRQRAARYGFDEEAYMAAVAKVPVLAEERVEALTRLYALLAQWLGDHALDHLRLRQAADELERFNRSLTRRVEEQTREISEQNARLADEIGERRQVEEALRERAEQLRLVLEGGELGFWDWNMETNSVQRNARWAEMLGYTHEEIRQTVKQWMDFVVPEDREVAWKSISDHLAGLTPQHRFEYRMLTKDGGYRWILDCAKVVGRDSDGRALRMCGTHTDITERKRSEERIRQLSRIYAALAKTNHASMHARSEAELFDAVCRIAVEEGGMKLAWIGTRTPGSDRIQPAARYGANPEYLDGIVISTNADEPEGCGPTGTAFREARAVLLQDFQTSSTTTPWRLRASHFGKWHASAAFPVMRNGNPYAVLTLYHAEKNAFDEQNVDLLLSMTSDVGFALDVFDSEARRQAAEQALRVSEER